MLFTAGSMNPHSVAIPGEKQSPKKKQTSAILIVPFSLSNNQLVTPSPETHPDKTFRQAPVKKFRQKLAAFAERFKQKSTLEKAGVIALMVLTIVACILLSLGFAILAYALAWSTGSTFLVLFTLIGGPILSIIGTVFIMRRLIRKLKESKQSPSN